MTTVHKGELRLKIRNLTLKDFGLYFCSVNNHLGRTMGTVTLHKLERPSTPKPITAMPSTQRPKLSSSVHTKPTRPKEPDFNNKPIRPPSPDFDDEEGSLEDIYNTVKPAIRRKPIANTKQVPKSKNYDPNNQNNMSNELYPWPINQSSAAAALIYPSSLVYLFCVLYLPLRIGHLY